MASAASPGQGGSAPPLAVQRGIVKMVLSGCAIIVRGQPRGGPPPERQINLSNIRAGNLARRAAAGQPDAKDTPDEPWGFPAREFLRKKLIGKEVCFTVEYKTPQGREYGMVYLGKDARSLFSVSAWRELGETMWLKTISGEEEEEEEIAAVREPWRAVLEALKALEAEGEAARAAARALAPEAGKDQAPKPGASAPFLGLPAAEGVTGTIRESVAETRASAEGGSGAVRRAGAPPDPPPPSENEEAAAGETERRNEPRVEALRPPARGEGRPEPPSGGAGDEARPPAPAPHLRPPLPPPQRGVPTPDSSRRRAGRGAGEGDVRPFAVGPVAPARAGLTAAVHGSHRQPPAARRGRPLPKMSDRAPGLGQSRPLERGRKGRHPGRAVGCCCRRGKPPDTGRSRGAD
ncbi:uncharacterized protein LOC142362241 [Opisthocomus hoazin]|uniref:uncharacterized protein LOC142362241 n=1 Tax=Opisthocomus hoazin TaxID=30419 RepID=UPI003F529574